MYVTHTHTHGRTDGRTDVTISGDNISTGVDTLLCTAFSTSNQKRQRLEYVWHFEQASWANKQRAWQFKLCQACGFTVHCCSTGDANSPVLWTKQLLQSILFAQVNWTIVNFANFQPIPDRRGAIQQFGGLTMHKQRRFLPTRRSFYKEKRKYLSQQATTLNEHGNLISLQA